MCENGLVRNSRCEYERVLVRFWVERLYEDVKNDLGVSKTRDDEGVIKKKLP